MQDVSFEQILILLLFFLFPLLQLAAERLRRRSAPRSGDAAAEAEAEAEISAPWEAEELLWIEAPMPDARIEIERPPVSVGERGAPTPSRRDDLEPWRRITGRATLRRAIVLAVILGPCRANEPPPRT